MLDTMKSDQYLNLCLYQAGRSPLQFRHGAVVVKGGKVLGHGFNDTWPGHDGTATPKTGRSHGGALTLHAEMMAIGAALGGRTACGIKPAAVPGGHAKHRRSAAVRAYAEAVVRAAGLGYESQGRTTLAEAHQWCIEGGLRQQQQQDARGLGGERQRVSWEEAEEEEGEEWSEPEPESEGRRQQQLQQ